MPPDSGMFLLSVRAVPTSHGTHTSYMTDLGQSPEISGTDTELSLKTS